MIADLKAYPEYKATKQIWLGDVPRHWLVVPNRALFSEVKERNNPDEEMLSVTIDRGIVRQKALLAGSSKKDNSNLDRSAYKLVKPRDIAYNKMRAWQGAIGASDYRGIISPAYIVMRLRREDNVPRYFHYLYRTPQFSKEAERWSYGITSDMWSLRPEHFKMIYTAEPPPAEQAAIVRFLDWANGRLERAIREKRKVMELLTEQKQAIIHRAVTRGLDNASLKPSLVPWLADIPEHWEVLKLKHLSPQITVGIVIQPARLYVPSGVPCLRSLNISTGTISTREIVFISEESHRANIKSELRAGDVAIVRTGRTGVAVLVPKEFDGANCVDLLLVRQAKRLLSGYLLMYLRSHVAMSDIAYNSVGAIQAHYNTGVLANLRIPLPPLDEQRAILQSLEIELAPIHMAISRLEREISLLREYRTRLVADVVTGKLDVREAAARLPKDAPTETAVPEDDMLSEPEPVE